MSDLSHIMVLNHLDFSSIFPPNDGASLPQHECPISLDLSLPNAKWDDSPAFSGQVRGTFGGEESSPRSEGSQGLGSGSSLEEAPRSEHGAERRRELGGRKGGRERGMNKSRHSMFKGVRERKGGRWVSEIREPGTKTRIWLGTFSTPQMAARAFDVAAFNLKTPYAYLNFPDYVSSLPILSSRSPSHLREAAGAVAALPALASSNRTGGLVATPSSTERPLPQSTIVETKASWLMMDDDTIFDMPNVLAHMAHGLMLTPPLHYLATANDADNNPAWDRAEFTLWNL